MLNKRLIKRWSFVLIILIAPLLAVSVNIMTGSDKGIITILLYNEDETCEVSSDIIDKIMNSDSIINYEKTDSADEGYNCVKSGGADALWIFGKDIEDSIAQAARENEVIPQVKIVERENTLALLVARERLYSSLYPYYNKEIYHYYVKNLIESGDKLTDEELQRIYDDEEIEGNIFERMYSEGGKIEEDTDYLLVPIRGMFAVWLVLCGLISCMYYINDRKNGIFDRTGTRHVLFMESGYHLVMIIIATIIMSAGIALAGIGTSWTNELLCMAVFVFTVTGYCCLVRRLFGNMKILGMVIPIIVILMFGLSPIFIGYREYMYFRFLQPVYLYITSVHSVSALIEMTVYGVVLYALSFVLDKTHLFTKF